MTTFQLYEDYTPPSWSMRPKYKYYLEILKNGVCIGEKPIDQKAMYLIGKNSQICDIALDNPTISRKHAVIQSKNTNEIFVYDLGSTHGTQVNNLKIPTKLFHKLKPFDQIRFGQSLRVYILRCPELEIEDAKEQENLIQQKIDKKKARKEYKSTKDHYMNLLYSNPNFRHLKPKRQEEEVDGIDWGIQDENEVYRYQQEQEYPLEPDILLQLPNLTESLTEKIQKYAEKLNTYRSQLGELDDLVVKERKNYGLDETKEKNKTDLEQKVQELGGELENLEVGLKYHLFGDKAAKKQQDFGYKSESSDDEFYDNTLTKKKVKLNDDVVAEPIILEKTTETYISLKKKLELLIEDRNSINEQLLNLKNNEEKQLEDEDELDAYMKQTAINIASEERPKLIIKLEKIMKEMEVVSNQLKFVKPEIINVASYFDEEKPNEGQDKLINEKQMQAEQQKQNNFIKTKLQELKKLQENEDQEEDEEKILENARKYFEKEGQKEWQKEQDRIKHQQRQQKNQQTYDQANSDEEVKQKISTATQKPKHSRNYKEAEIGSQAYVDITKFI